MKIRNFSFIFFAISTFFSPDLFGQDDSKQLSLSIIVGVNIAYSAIPTGFYNIATTNEYFIHPAGTTSIGFSFVKRFKKKFELAIDYFNQNDEPTIKNGTLKMSFNSFQGIFRYKLTSKPNRGWYLGLGLNSFIIPKLTLDASQISNGYILSSNYKNSFSPVTQLSYIMYPSKRFICFIHINSFFNRLSSTSIKYNNKDIIPDEIKSKYDKISASGLSFLCGLGYNF